MPDHKSHRAQGDKSKDKDISLGDVRREVNRQLDDVWEQIDAIKAFVKMPDDDDDEEPTPPTP